MPKKKRKLFIAIPEENIKREFGWFHERWGEDAVKTYIVKNSEIIDRNLVLIGVGELWHPPLRDDQPSSSDLIFRKGNVYYIVEVKNATKYAWAQLFDEVACFEHDMEEHDEHYEEVIPVLVIVDVKIKEERKVWSEVE